MVSSSEVGAQRVEAAAEASGRASVIWTLYSWVHVLTCLLFGALVTIVVGSVAYLLGDGQRRIAHHCVRVAYRCITKFHPRYRLSITGLERLPRGGYVLCPNHQSLSDVVYLLSLPLHFKFVIKRELFRVPLFGTAMRVAGYPMIDRGDPKSGERLLATAGGYLQQGIPVLSFPEGTRSTDGTLGRFNSGPARMAVANEVPLVPVGVYGTQRLLPRGSVTYPSRAHVVIHIGEPIPTADATARDVRALTRALKQGVIAAKQTAQTLGES